MSQNKFTEKDKKALYESLKKYANGNSITRLSELEGMLVGLLCRSEHAHTQEMLDLIWGESEDDHPSWHSQTEVEDFLGSLFSLQNKNNTKLKNAHYKPYILKEKKHLEHWCRGFLKGLGDLDLLSIDEEENLDFNFAALTVLVLSNEIPVDTPMLSQDEQFDVFQDKLKEISIAEFGRVIKIIHDELIGEVGFQGVHHHHHEHGSNCVH